MNRRNIVFGLLLTLAGGGAATIAFLNANPAIGKTVSAQVARVTVTNHVVTALEIRRDGTAAVEVASRGAGNVIVEVFRLPMRDGECGGVRIRSDGEPEAFTMTGATCATDVLTAFRTTSGSVAARLDAVETALGADGRLP